MPDPLRRVHNVAMTTKLVPAVARRTAPASTARRVSLTARAAAQHAGHVPVVLDRVATDDGNVPGASAFQSAL
jgi:hypothetical protein